MDRRSPDQSMDVIPATIAVTGVAGLLAQRLLPHLDAMDGVDRIVGLDVREPARRVRRFEFHRVDIASSDLTAVLDGVETIVHLAGVVAGTPDRSLLAHVDIEGTRACSRRPAARGTSCRCRAPRSTARGPTIRSRSPRTRRCDRIRGSSPRCTTPRTSAVSPNGASSGVRRRPRLRRRCAWPRSSGRARTVSSRAPRSAVRRSRCGERASDPGRARRRRGRALALAVERRLDGVYNVAADGWLSDAAVRGLVGKRSARVARRDRAPRAAGAVVERARRRTARTCFRISCTRGSSPTTGCAQGWAPVSLERRRDPRLAPARTRGVGQAPGRAHGGRGRGDRGRRVRCPCGWRAACGSGGAAVRCVSRHSCQSGVK